MYSLYFALFYVFKFDSTKKSIAGNFDTVFFTGLYLDKRKLTVYFGYANLNYSNFI